MVLQAHHNPLSLMDRITLFSLLLLRRLSSQKLHLLRATRPIFFSHPLLNPKYFSSISSAQTTTGDPKPTSLSARMSFVFHQIDAIERERSEKDETLQRIRAWRESKKTKPDEKKGLALKPSECNSGDAESGELEVKKEEDRGVVGLVDRKVEVVHPWPEWIEFMERLVQQNYFDHRRKDEDKMVEDLGFKIEEASEDLGFDFTRDWNLGKVMAKLHGMNLHS